MLKIPRGYVDIYGNSGEDLVSTIVNGLGFECPSRTKLIPVHNIEYFVWEKLDGGVLIWT